MIATCRRALCLGALLVVVAMAAGGCLMAPVVPPMGSFYTHIEAPLDLDSQGGKAIGPKRGEATCKAYAGMVSVGDASVRAAAKNGGIERVNHVDYRFKNYLLGLYSSYTTIAYGE